MYGVYNVCILWAYRCSCTLEWIRLGFLISNFWSTVPCGIGYLLFANVCIFPIDLCSCIQGPGSGITIHKSSRFRNTMPRTRFKSHDLRSRFNQHLNQYPERRKRQRHFKQHLSEKLVTDFWGRAYSHSVWNDGPIWHDITPYRSHHSTLVEWLAVSWILGICGVIACLGVALFSKNPGLFLLQEAEGPQAAATQPQRALGPWNRWKL